MQQLIQLKNQGHVQEDNEVGMENTKKESSTNGTTLPTKNSTDFTENIGLYNYIRYRI
jgi:hypothetical protein